MLYDILNARTKPSDKALYNIWARKLSGGWTEQEITGTLPLTFNAKAGDLTDFTIYGTAEGAGVQTESGEPAGFKIPLTVTSGQNTDTYPIYIGSTKLGAEEYVDYQEQKVYKRTVNYFTEEGSGLVQVNSLGILRFGKSFKNFSAGTYTCSFTRTGSGNFYISTRIGTTYSDIARINYPAASTTFTLNDDVDELILRTAYTADIGWDHTSFSYIMLVPGSTVPETFIPYFQPTDPPSPLLSITAYQGENTLSSTETVGNVTIKGKIKAVT